MSGSSTEALTSTVGSAPLARLGDVTEAAEILIDDPLAQRQPAPLTVAMNGFQDHSGHQDFLSWSDGGLRAPERESDNVTGH